MNENFNGRNEITKFPSPRDDDVRHAANADMLAFRPLWIMSGCFVKSLETYCMGQPAKILLSPSLAKSSLTSPLHLNSFDRAYMLISHGWYKAGSKSGKPSSKPFKVQGTYNEAVPFAARNSHLENNE